MNRVMTYQNLRNFAYVNDQICIQPFKGSLSSLQAGGAVAEAIKKVYARPEITMAPLADGGDGKLDGQSAMGKAPIGLARLAKKYHKPVIAFSGCAANEAGICNACGIDAFSPILRTPCSFEEAMDIPNAYKNLTNTAEQVFRLLKLNL